MTAWAPIAQGSRQQLRVRQLGRWWSWTAAIRDVVPGRSFTDSQLADGPFARWDHTHTVEGSGNAAHVIDDLVWAPPGGAIGRLLAGPLLRPAIARTFAFRHRRTTSDLAWLSATALPASVAVTGASGVVGSALCAFLEAGGVRVVRLGRRPGPGVAAFDPAHGVIDGDALEGVDAVVHLAGEPVAQRWSPSVKRRILDSRVVGTTLLSQTLASLSTPPRVLIAGSATGFYGDQGDAALTEDSPAGETFLAGVAAATEAATQAANGAGIRVVHLRTGVVITLRGGALRAQLPTARIGLAGPVGGGKQWVPWIALDDLIGLITHAMASDVRGALNAVSPEPVRQADFSRTLARVLRRPSGLPVPAAVVRALWGEVASETLLTSQRVSPTRAVESGFSFHFADLADALAFSLGRAAPT